MNFKRRLIISNILIIIIPILITFILSFVGFVVVSKVFSIDKEYVSIRKATSIYNEFFEVNENLTKYTPDVLLEEDFQEYISQRLTNLNIEIIIKKNRETVFSTKHLGMIDLNKSLQSGKNTILNNKVEIDGEIYISKTIPVTFEDGDNGNVLMLALTRKDWLTFEKFMIGTLIIFMVSFLITNLILIFNLSNKFLNPLNKLKDAAVNITNGNLDFEIVEAGDEEIRQICSAFEHMRLKLKDSIASQSKYNESRKMLLTSISHDLRTPITSIKGYVEGIIDGVADSPDKVTKYLRTIYSKAELMDKMIDDISLYSKLDLKQLPFKLEKTDIESYFKDCVEDIKSELEQDNINIELRSQLKESKIVLIDRDRVKRVVMNIIGNSRKYMDNKEGKIEILLRETNSSIISEIKDNGAGIDEQDIPFVFDKFYRADFARDMTKGSGLGLAIARQIIEGIGGSIWLISKKNKGTSVFISLEKIKP